MPTRLRVLSALAWFFPGLLGAAPDPAPPDGAGAGLANIPLPTSVADFGLPGTQPGDHVEPILESGQCTEPCHGNGFNEADLGPEARGTMMANASIDPLFEACLAIAEQDAPGSGDLCLRCHIPKAWLAGRSTPTDGSAVAPSDRIGLSCNFCHRMVNPIFDEDPQNRSPDEDLSILGNLVGGQPLDYGNGMYVIQPAQGFYGHGGMRGPKDGGNSPHHEIIKSPFHKTGEFCGTCHDVSNPLYTRTQAGNYVLGPLNQHAPSTSAGALMPIERTYSEWKWSYGASDAGIYTPGFGLVRTCQDCHMAEAPGRACALASTAERPDLSHHDFTGGNAWMPQVFTAWGLGDAAALAAAGERARETLRKAAQVEAEQQGDRLRVRVINNTGHKLPTGYPEGRRMWVQVRFKDKAERVLKVSGEYRKFEFEDYSDIVSDPELKVYEAELGISNEIGALTALPPGQSFHFVLNNVVLKDNRIPPRGFTNANFRSFNGEPVGAQYADGQYWDDTSYRIPLGTAFAEVFLYYQTASGQYVQFLRDQNRTNDRGQLLYEAWKDNPSPPFQMSSQSLTINGLTTVHVNPDAGGIGTGTNWFDAFTTLEAGLEAANANECITEVLVAAGTYGFPRGSSPAETFRVRNGLTVRGGYGGGGFLSPIAHDPSRFETILDGAGSQYHVVTMDDATTDPPAVLQHLTIRNGNAADRSGMGGGLFLLGGNAVVEHCRFLDHKAVARGGAIAVLRSRLVLNGCSLEHSRAAEGGAVYVADAGSDLEARSCRFAFNRSTGSGGAAYLESEAGPVFVNCLFDDNVAEADGGALHVAAGSVRLISSTISRNRAFGLGGGVQALPHEVGIVTIYNTILWGNAHSGPGGQTAQLGGASAAFAVTYSCVQDGTPGDLEVIPGTGNVDGDPLFLDPVGGDFSLRSGSPAIDAGDTGVVDSHVDLAFAPRVVDDPGTPDTGAGLIVVDMGALEFTRRLHVDGSLAADAIQNGRTWKTAFRQLRQALDVALVPGSPIAEIWVADGYYQPAPAAAMPDREATFRLRSGLAIYGGFEGSEDSVFERDPDENRTVLTGDLFGNDASVGALAAGTARNDNSYHVVTAEGVDPTAVLDGFEVYGGSAALTGGEGGGLLLDASSPTITDCKIRNNQALVRGGGVVILNGSAPLFRRCSILLNESVTGGGMFVLQSAPKLVACKFTANQASGGGGGGIYFQAAAGAAGQPGAQVFDCALVANAASGLGGAILAGGGSALEVINSTFSRNETEATNAGGIRVNDSSLALLNCILWGNLAATVDLTDAQLRGVDSTVTVRYCCLQGGWNGTPATDIGNLAHDPFFVSPPTGDLRLLAGSPCIDAADGRAALATGFSRDLLGRPRFHDDPATPNTGVGPDDAVVDMGAHEFDASLEAPNHGDVDRDGRVTIADFTEFWYAMTGPGGTASRAARDSFDFDQDGAIDMVDLIAMAKAMAPPARIEPLPPLQARVTSGGAAEVVVEPGARIEYEVHGLLGDRGNLGLAAIFFDLAFSGGSLAPAHTPDSGPLANFVPLEGMTNPQGYRGTEVGDGLAQVGGMQNTVGATPRDVPYPTGEVLTGVGHEEVVVVSGSLTAPATEGSYTLAVFNLGGAVLAAAPGRGPGGGPPLWPIASLVPGSLSELRIEVRADSGRQLPGDCNQDRLLNISDGVCLLSFLFRGTPSRLPCDEEARSDPGPGDIRLADWNGDGRVDLSDGVGLLGFLFSGGPSHALDPGGSRRACVPIAGCEDLCAP